MTDNETSVTFNVVQDNGQWTIQRVEKTSQVFGTKEEAIEAAKKLATEKGTSIVIRDKDGSSQTPEDYSQLKSELDSISFDELPYNSGLRLLKSALNMPTSDIAEENDIAMRSREILNTEYVDYLVERKIRRNNSEND